MVDRNIVLYENEKFTKTDSQLPIDPDPWAWWITLRRSTVYVHENRFHVINALFFPQDNIYSVLRFFSNLKE